MHSLHQMRGLLKHWKLETSHQRNKENHFFKANLTNKFIQRTIAELK